MNCEIGKIKSLALRDFLTYDEVRYIPGKNLNIIIGPNGTGKSTIVAGIILGCGGKPALLSRSKDITDFVKNGKTKAHIEIELQKNEDDTVVFHRSFDKDGKETYSVDGSKVSIKAYTERIRTFNIQVDNLCIFLPQDRVQDFTKLNAQELLHNTQISVCSEQANDAFASLKKKRESQKSSAKHNVEILVQLTDNINRNEQLHTMIENNRTKEQLIETRNLYEKKKVWLEFDIVKAKYDEAATDVKKLQDLLVTKRNELKPLEKKQQDIAGTKAKLKNDIISSSAGQNKIATDVDRMIRETEKINSDIRQSKRDLENIIKSSRNYEKDVEELRLKIRLDSIEYQNAKEELKTQNHDAAITEFDQKIAKIKTQVDDLSKKRQTTIYHMDEKITPSINATKHKLSRMTDSIHLRFQTLRNNFEDAYKATEWLKNNRDKFNGHIFNPILTEISVTDKRYAKYVENCVGNRDFETFLCTDKADMTKLIKIFRNDMKLKVNVGFTEPTERLLFEPLREVSEYPKEYGILAYLIEMIDGPAPVLNYLCKLYGIHNILVGNDLLEKYASKLPNDIKVFFSTNTRFSVTISRYNGDKSTQSNDIYPRNIVDVGVDQEEIDAENQKLHQLVQRAETFKAERVNYENMINELEKQRETIRNSKNEIISQIRRVNNLGQCVNRKEVELENMLSQKVDIDIERRKIKTNNDKLIEKLLMNVDEVTAQLVKHKDFTVKGQLAKKKLKIFDDDTGNVDQKIEEMKRIIREFDYALSNAKRDTSNLENRMISKRREALEWTDHIDQNSAQFPYKKEFEKLPATIEELQDKIDEMKGRIECIRGIDPAIIEEYEQRKTTIETLRENLQRAQEKSGAIEDEIKALHNVWHPEITKIVASINNNFSNFFSKMGFVGEVELIHKEERDYADYGIAIRVQYRDNEKLQALNRHVQSGGERAVAIAVYTLSLQHLTMVPFRCVDEINQGMDPNNERKIFQMLVDITCREGQSQYFFITPKLLPDLPYDDLMTITVVHNGKNINDPYVFESDDEANESQMETN